MSQTDSESRQNLVTALQKAEIESRRLAILWGDSLGLVLGLHPTDAIALIFLLDADEATAGELARAVGLTTGAMTACIDRLERAGFASRASHPNDRRKVIVRAGKLPKRLLDLREAARARLSATLDRYSDDELRRLIEFKLFTNDLLQLSISAHLRTISDQGQKKRSS